jgi:hypothetical protein
MDEQHVTSGTGATSPFVVAHRAGNDLLRLNAAAALGLPLAEADVHLYRGRLEVRHRKTAGPLPVLWDRWELAPASGPRLLLEDLLASAPEGGPELMLDLKGHDPRLADRVLEAVRDRGRVTVCSQDWRLLGRMAEAPGVRIVHSVGGRRALARLLAGGPVEAVSIHRRLLDAPSVAALRRRTGLVMSWPVETVPDARRLAGLGVDGMISRSFETLAAALPAPVAVAA